MGTARKTETTLPTASSLLKLKQPFSLGLSVKSTGFPFGKPSIVLILIMRQRQRAGPDLAGHAPVDQSLLAAMCDPHFDRGDLLGRGGQLVPVGMVGYDQRQLDIALPRALADAYPSAPSRTRNRIDLHKFRFGGTRPPSRGASTAIRVYDQIVCRVTGRGKHEGGA